MPRWTMTLEERFWSKVDRRAEDECWPWTGITKADGYGLFRVSSARQPNAHRVAYELANAVEVPPGYEVDHICFNRSCCNPAHLRMLTTSQNRSRSKRYEENKCYRGHELTEDNLYPPNLRHGQRACWTCRRAYEAARKAKSQRMVGGGWG